MIKANELRIGNYLHDLSGGVIQVRGTNYQGIWIKDSGGPASVESFKPIPITEEWVLRLGFEKIPHFTITNSLIKNIGRNRHISIGDIGTPNLMVYLCEKEYEDSRKITDLICLHNWDYVGEMYLHQLQNLYFALTGEELHDK